MEAGLGAGVVFGGGGALAVPLALEELGEAAQAELPGRSGLEQADVLAGGASGVVSPGAAGFEVHDGGPVEAVDCLAPLGCGGVGVGLGGPVFGLALPGGGGGRCGGEGELHPLAGGGAQQEDEQADGGGEEEQPFEEAADPGSDRAEVADAVEEARDGVLDAGDEAVPPGDAGVAGELGGVEDAVGGGAGGGEVLVAGCVGFAGDWRGGLAGPCFRAGPEPLA